MSETHDPTEYTEVPIDENVERIETIIERLESGEPSLAVAEELRTEGEARLQALRERLDVGDGELRQLE